MIQVEKIILLALAGLVTALLVYTTVRLSTADITYSVIPGWHTTMYPPDITWTALTIIILAISLIVCVIFRATLRLFTLLWSRMKSDRQNWLHD